MRVALHEARPASVLEQRMAVSHPGIADVDVIRGASDPRTTGVDLVIEIPHGATRTTDFTSLEAQLTSKLPAGLVDFFHVNTDAGAPELAVATARALVAAHPTRAVAIVRCQIPRTFIDCNRRMDASPSDFREGKVTPGLMPWITTPEDRALLRGLYDRYLTLVHDTLATLATDGALLLLHTYAPRSVEISVDDNIVTGLRSAYLPANYDTWQVRPPIDIIARTLEGVDHAPAAVLAELRAQGVEFSESATYPMHPSTLAFGHVTKWPGRVLCVEVRRDLLAEPWAPFAQMTISPVKVADHAGPLAAAIARWF